MSSREWCGLPTALERRLIPYSWPYSRVRWHR